MKYKTTIKRELSQAQAWHWPNASSFDAVKLLRFSLLSLLLMFFGGLAHADYQKVTSTADITDGEYLIVYETGNVAFNGSL